MGLKGFAAADGIDALVALAFDVDPVGIDTEDLGEARDDLGLAVFEAGGLEDNRGIEVGQFIAGLADAPDGLGEEVGRILGFVAGVIVGEELADIRLADRPEEGVGDGVSEGVRIRMPDRPEVGLKGNAPQDHRAAPASGGEGFEPMEVVAVADAEVWWMHGWGLWVEFRGVGEGM